MKKVLLSLIAIVSLTAAKAQFTMWATNDYAYGPSSEFELITNSFLKNTGNSTTTYVWQMERLILPPGWSSVVCIDICHDTDVYTGQFSLAPGDTSALDVHAYPRNVGGSGSVKITVYPLGNPGDKQSDTFYFNAWALSVKNNSRQNEVELYPNPATTELNITLATEKPVTFKVCNILGQVKMQHEHSGKTSAIDVSELPAGIYFLGYTNDKGPVIYKKFKKI